MGQTRYGEAQGSWMDGTWCEGEHCAGRAGREKVLGLGVRCEQVQPERPVRGWAEMLSQHWKHRSKVQVTQSAWRQIW